MLTAPPPQIIVKFSRGLLISYQLSVNDEVFCICAFFILNNMIKLHDNIVHLNFSFIWFSFLLLLCIPTPHYAASTSVSFH